MTLCDAEHHVVNPVSDHRQPELRAPLLLAGVSD
jgi:hypothetical protein